MPLSLYDLSMIVIVHAAIQLTGLAFIIVVAVRGFRDMRRGHEELIRLSRTTGAFIFQEDEKIRALVNARFDEIMRQLPR